MTRKDTENMTSRCAVLIVLSSSCVVTGAEPTTNSIGMKFVRVPAGKFEMGCSGKGADSGKDETRHTVTITRGFLLAVVPVTNANYRLFDPKHTSGRYEGTDLDGDDHPVVQVSWDDAVKYCRWLSNLPQERRAGRQYRLPTEAEWEYACRAGTTSAYSWGDEIRADACNFADRRAAALRLAWADGAADDGHAGSSPVGAYPANAWGLRDMHGNVWQWCADRYGHEYRDDKAVDPTGPAFGSTRVLRGGSWYARAAMCRSAARIAFDPDQRRPCFGLRVVCIQD